MAKENLTETQINSMCLCPGCPSFVECRKKSFCITGKSACILKKKGCLCPGCPVENKMGFKHAYYCIAGSEKSQKGK